ncbi:MAG: gamma-glutamyl-gamma-aminobutyrate hydrolase family protein [Planctomycetes bacterium]|nr:gamma-glutamyl-gamma-aminobutyrate hydrolase family protein [Planctomycetota bacterium]
MKFLVGLNCDYEPDARNPHAFLYDRYVDTVVKAGALPLLLPHLTGKDDAKEILDPLDALILTGCDDYAPSLYGAAAHPKTECVGPRKQQSDLWLAAAALARGVPILGICGGMQLLNILRGGSLIQDLPGERPDALQHRKSTGETDLPRHRVLIERGTRLHEILAEDRIETNSSHHQAIHRVADGFAVSARATDGVIEAIEQTDRKALVLGVQWHPEYTPEDKPTFGLLRALLAAAGRFRYGMETSGL